MDITYGPQQADERLQTFRVRSAALGGPPAPDLERPQLAEANVIVARLDGTVVGASAFSEFGQVFGGRVQPMGGVIGVAVASHVGGRGVAKELMARLFDVMLERGMVISTLYPSTSTLYRALGYESAGTWTRRSIPLADLIEPDEVGLTVREESPEVYETVRHLHEAHAERTNGWMVRDEWWWQSQQYECAQPDGHRRVFVAYRGAEPVAFGVIENTSSSADRRSYFDLELIDAFGEPNGLAAICSTLANMGMMAGDLHTVLGDDDLAALTNRPEQLRVERHEAWMMRILDLRAALTGREGGAFEGEVHVEVDDPHIARNNGRFVLSCSSGAVTVQDGGTGRVSMMINDLSAMYTGFRSPESLRLRGRLGDASHADVEALTRLFAAPRPTLVDSF